MKICRELGANELLDSKASSAFLNTELFEKSKIKVVFQNYKHPCYEQVYKPFVGYMSALDLLLNCGHKSLDIILGT